jgi:uncharacterized protein involved in type VI secretion and phage assembly
MSILDTLTTGDRDANRVLGVAAGIVTNNQDPDGLGRVKIKFPWLSDENESDWARVTTLMAGGQRGTFFLPEVGDEVLVAFEHGDINYPFVIGSLWNGNDNPPETNSDGKNNIRKIKSRSGHEIVFDDNDEQSTEKLEIKTNGGHTVVLDDSSGQEQVGIQSKAGHKVVLNDASGQEKIEIVDKAGSNKIVIDSMQNAINIESGMQLKIKANIVEIEGTTSLTLKSSAIVTIQGMPVKIN